MSKLAFRAQKADIAYLPVKGFLAKNILMTAQRDYGLGNSPSSFGYQANR